MSKHQRKSIKLEYSPEEILLKNDKSLGKKEDLELRLIMEILKINHEQTDQKLKDICEGCRK